MSQTFRSYAALGDFDAATRSVPVIASTRNPVRAPFVDAEGNATMRLESLESWDLRRFAKNPIILAVHDQGSIGAIIGDARDVQETPRGLEMRIFLAAAHDAPEVVDIENKLKKKLLRGVSVGFTYGPEQQRGTIDGLPYSSFTQNELNEVSFVPIPADADALVDTPEARAAAEAQRGLGCMDPPDEAKRKADLSEHAKALSAARKPAQQKLDFSDPEFVQHFDRLGDLGKVERTQVGGIRVPARLTRVGVLRYVRPDGTVSRQLRLPEEVFDAASLETLTDAPVTDMVHHKALISPDTFRDAALGHARDARPAGKYVEATLVVNDAETANAIERGDLSDISCGYTCKHDHSPGTYDGEPYDLIHREIRYNHVAVLPPGKGRAGREVSIQLDSTEAAVWCFDEGQAMAIDDKTKTIIKLDGKDFEYGSTAHLDKIDSLHTTEITKVRGELTALKSQYDVLQGKFDAAEVEATEAKKNAAGAKAAEDDKFMKRVKSKVRLLMRSLRLFGNDDDNDEEDKEEAKMDAIDELVVLSDRDLMIRCLNKTDAFKEAKFDGKSDDYVMALFDNLKDPKPAGGVDDVVLAHRKVSHSDSTDDALVKADIERQRKEAATPAWKRPLQMTKG